MPFANCGNPLETNSQMTNALIVRPNIEQIVALRTRALDAYERAYDLQARSLELATEASLLAKAAASGFSFPGLREEGAPKFDALHAIFNRIDRDAFLRDARWSTDADVWEYLLQASGFHTLMDKQAKDSVRWDMMGMPRTNDGNGQVRIGRDGMAYDDNGGRAPAPKPTGPIEVTEENLAATLEGFMAQADMLWRRGIANVFSKLDRRFKSHDGWKIGNRLILDMAFDCSFRTPSWRYQRDHQSTFMDIERVFRILDGKDPTTAYAGIVGAADKHFRLDRSDWHGLSDAEKAERDREHTERNTFPILVHGDYFRVRIFKNGNAHLWFERDDLVLKVNKLLGEYYGEVLPHSEREPTDEEIIQGTVKTEIAKNFGFFPTPDEAAKRAFTATGLSMVGDNPKRVLEPSAGTGNLAILAAQGGHSVDCIEIQQPLAETLKNSKRFGNVWRADFLAMSPEVTGLYDVILMNPVFDRERDIDHVTHALKFLKPGGRLVAIMSAGTEFRETKKSIAFRRMIEAKRVKFRSNDRGPFEDLPPGSFASVGTYVNTLILAIDLPS